MNKELTPAMERALSRIRSGHFHLVDLSSARGLERRGLVRIERTFHQGREVPAARRYHLL